MFKLLSLAVLPSASLVLGQNPCSASFDSEGKYTVSCGSWLSLQGYETSVTMNGARLTDKDGSLSFVKASSGSGTDSWGDFTTTSSSWKSSSSESVIMVTTLRVYSSVPAIVFQQDFPYENDIQTNLTEKNRDSTSSAFPSFVYPSTPSSSIGFMEYAGPFLNRGLAGPVFGPWGGSQSQQSYSSGMASGPTILFDTNTNAAVLSSCSNFMSASQELTPNSFNFGVMGAAAVIPTDHSVEFVLWVSDAGVNNAIASWGQGLLDRYGKKNDASKTDYTNTMLGYNTDHGAYYYYTTKPFPDYTAALTAVYNQSVSQKIPYKVLLLDSWWYYKGEGGGVKNWTAMPSVFPGGQQGLQELLAKTGWRVTAHNRYWSGNTDYASQNGGDYDFYVDSAGSPAGGSMALPLESRFWVDLFTNTSTEWGTNGWTYEQDWLYNELGGVDILLTDVDAGRTWLKQMGLGAQSTGLSIQYCMSYPRHTLQSVEIPPVTQVRASDDHVPSGTAMQWRIGYSSMFSYALGVAPFKDNAWSSSQEPGGSCGNAIEASPGLHLAISVFSAGPVMPGDGIEFMNRDQIMRTTTDGGVLLHPSRPMTSIDAGVIGQVFKSQSATSGPLYATYSKVADWTWSHILAADLAQPFTVLPEHLQGTISDQLVRKMGVRAFYESKDLSKRANEAPGDMIYYTLNTTTLDISTLTVSPFDASHGIPVPACGEIDFVVYHVAPVFNNGWSILGELTKWVPVAEARTRSITTSTSGISVLLFGEPGEYVPYSFYNGTNTITVECFISDDGSATVSVPDRVCI